MICVHLENYLKEKLLCQKPVFCSTGEGDFAEISASIRFFFIDAFSKHNCFQLICTFTITNVRVATLFTTQIWNKKGYHFKEMPCIWNILRPEVPPDKVRQKIYWHNLFLFLPSLPPPHTLLHYANSIYCQWCSWEGGTLTSSSSHPSPFRFP